MARYIFKRYYRDSNGEMDDENIWVEANSKSEALYMVRSEYPTTLEFVLLRTENG